MRIKTIVIILTIIIIWCILMPISNAALQSNGGTAAKYGIETWITNIRKMETLGGTLGLTETIKSDLTSSSGSNNVDIHMEKNTEYGAIAILSASSYGNPSKIANGETTTGNESGIYMYINQEWVAGGTISWSSIYSQANNKYKNIYTESYVAKKGDAITETSGWHGSTSSQWLAWKNVWNRS